jgi:hypothetical protein
MGWGTVHLKAVEKQILLGIGLLIFGLLLCWAGFYAYNRYVRKTKSTHS